MPKVSVNICCYNAERYLDETLRSVINQTYDDWEIVVVDDGSTDRTEEIVRSYVGQGLPIVYHKQPNRGLGAARNVCISLSSGEWIALIDHDDLCLPRRLEVQVALAERYPEVALFFGDSDYIDEDGVVIGRHFERIKMNPYEWDLSSGKGLGRLLSHGCFIDTETVFVRKEAVVTVGGFDERYRYITDYDFFLKVAERHTLRGDQRAVSRWRIHPGQASRTMNEEMLTEHIELLRRWCRHPAVDSRSRHAIGESLHEKLMQYADYLRSEGRRVDSIRHLLKAILVSPKRRGPYGRLLRNVAVIPGALPRVTR